MKNTILFLLLILGFNAWPTLISCAQENAPGVKIYVSPGNYRSDDYKPVEGWENWEWVEDTNGSQSKKKERLSHPFPNQTETPVFMAGNAVLVPVKLGHRGKEISTLLVFDTGATTTVLHKSVANQLGIVSTASNKTLIADGSIINTKTANLDYIIVGPYRMDNFQAVIIEHKNDSSRVKGLLGMNFLRTVNYTIDFDRKKIIWSTK